MGVVAENRRVVVRLPDHLIDALDRAADGAGRHRSELIRESVEWYLAEQKRHRIRQELIQGYQEMSGLNAAIAEERWDMSGFTRE